MAKKLTYEEVKHFIEVESDSDCKLLSEEYINSSKKLNLECKCGNEFLVTLNSFKCQNKRHCDECGAKMQREKMMFTYEYVKNYIEVESRSGYKLLSEEYNGFYEPLTFQCDKGHIYKTKFARFSEGCRCTVCNELKGSNKKHSYEYVKNYIEKFNYKLLSKEYKGNRHKIDIECDLGHTYKTTFTTFKTGSRCPTCFGTHKKTTKQFKSEVYELVGNEYDVIGEYKTNKTKIKMKHNKCKYEWLVTPASFLCGGRRCPQCNESKGEQRIREQLQTMKMIYMQEYAFEDLLSDKNVPLRFDFAIFDNRNKIKFLIEYDGEQHFEHIKGMMTKEKYKALQIHDKRKNQYCKDNNIPLIRIPHWQFDKIEDILNKWLSKYELIHKENIKEAV